MRDKVVEYVASHSKIIFTGKVIDNSDYRVLGRIRVFPDQENIQQILLSYDGEGILNDTKDDVKDEIKFTNKDPFVFMPLLPFAISYVPKVGELVLIMYSNPEQNSGRKNQYYLPGPKSDVTNIEFERYEQSLEQTALGSNIAGSPNFKTINLEYRNKKVKGVFAEPGDNAIYGQGTTDLILKQNDVLLRAGKVNEFIQNQVPSANEKRGFLQLSYFNIQQSLSEPTKKTIQSIDDSPLSKLIEYDITAGLDNNFNSYTGAIYIYDIPPSNSVKNNEFTDSTVLPSNVTTPVFTYQFIGIPLTGVTYLINTVIDGLNLNAIDIKAPYNPKLWKPTNNRFPYYYRPSKRLRDMFKKNTNQSSPSDIVQFANLTSLLTSVRFSFAFNPRQMFGSGLVSAFSKFGTRTKTETVNSQPYTTKNTPNSVGVLGSNKVFLLSHDSTIPGKQKVNLSPSTIYGLTQSEIANNIVPNTEPMVRGESLKKLLNLIVKFLVSHAHPYHQLPPTPVSDEGTSVADIEVEFQNYDSTIVNQNIRIN